MLPVKFPAAIRCCAMGLRAVFLALAVVPACLAQITWLLSTKTKIDIYEYRKCPDQGTGEMDWNLRLHRVSRDLLVVEGNISLSEPLDENISGNIIVAEKGNGGWMERMFVFKLPNLCADIHLILGSGWTSFWEKAGVAPPVKCPIQKGNYTVTDYSTKEFEKNTIPRSRQGTFKVDLEFLRRSTQKRMGCISFVMNTKPQ
ncbi:uncharacterized protein LOC124369877 [Homalodisca vitripennis]|uniref:uncharacterized protein LOC124369877 n=1 Tax=Homalodisca vitripennis TaxID=197043 RepID=UPI001EEABC25|nr:uncharacterized protein LOC124369877 [Homalodisca vitripennis]